MSELKICRICLRTECKVYNYDRFQLKSYYEEVMAQKIDTKDGLPHYFCYECAMTLYKFHKFKEKCFMGQKVLKEVTWLGPITYEAVYKINRKAKRLKSSLDILMVTKRVKTYCTKDDRYPSSSPPLSSESVNDSDDDSVVNFEETVDNFEETVDNFEEIDDKNDVLIEDSNNGFEETDPIDEKEVIDESILKNLLSKLHDEGSEEICESDTTIVKPNSPEPNSPEPKSPETVFVDIQKEIVKLKQKRMKKLKNVKRKPQFQKHNNQHIDDDLWIKSTFTEEEAIQVFRAKAEDAKYLAAPFKCTDCYKWFTKEDILKRHKIKRHIESIGRQECRFCHMRFRFDSHLRKHMRQHYSLFKCRKCSLVCNLETSAQLHQEYHSGFTKNCEHCGEEFKHRSTYYTHLRTHRSDFICTLCGASFVSTLGLLMHKKAKHVGLDENAGDEDDGVSKTFCEKCNIRFETSKAYSEHLFHSAMHDDGVEHEGAERNTVPRKVLARSMKDKIINDLVGRQHDEDDVPLAKIKIKRRKMLKRSSKKPTTCHQCGVEFDTQAACMKHHLVAHPRTSFYPPSERQICEICGASLAPGSWAVHQNIHSKEKVYPCETCGRSFNSQIGLKRHSVPGSLRPHMYQHLKKKSHSCVLCRKTFGQKATLNRHMLTHTGEKPFGCTLCDKRFTQSNSMKLHYRTFHLKQPYPKRNRRKKTDEIPLDGLSGMECSDVNDQDDSRSGTEHRTEHHHYLTLH